MLALMKLDCYPSATTGWAAALRPHVEPDFYRAKTWWWTCFFQTSDTKLIFRNVGSEFISKFQQHENLILLFLIWRFEWRPDFHCFSNADRTLCSSSATLFSCLAIALGLYRLWKWTSDSSSSTTQSSSRRRKLWYFIWAQQSENTQNQQHVLRVSKVEVLSMYGILSLYFRRSSTE